MTTVASGSRRRTSFSRFSPSSTSPDGGRSHVEEIDVRLGLGEASPLGCVLRPENLELVLERPEELVEQDGVVLDDQDPTDGRRRHGRSPAAPAEGGSEAADSSFDGRVDPGNFSRTSVPPPGREWIWIVPR